MQKVFIIDFLQGPEYVSVITIFDTARKMKFSIKDFFRKCDQIRKKPQIWSHLLKKSLMENLFFRLVWIVQKFTSSSLDSNSHPWQYAVIFENS